MDFRKEVDRNSRVIIEGMENIIRLTKVNVDVVEASATAQQESLQVNVAAVSIAAAAEALLKLCHELKLSLLMEARRRDDSAIEGQARRQALAARISQLTDQLHAAYALRFGS